MSLRFAAVGSERGRGKLWHNLKANAGLLLSSIANQNLMLQFTIWSPTTLCARATCKREKWHFNKQATKNNVLRVVNVHRKNEVVVFFLLDEKISKKKRKKKTIYLPFCFVGADLIRWSIFRLFVSFCANWSSERLPSDTCKQLAKSIWHYQDYIHREKLEGFANPVQISLWKHFSS